MDFYMQENHKSAGQGLLLPLAVTGTNLREIFQHHIIVHHQPEQLS